MSGWVEGKIDQLNLIFKLIFEDEDLPSPVKQQLARLQIYVFITAIQEDGFLRRSSNPARRLLDGIISSEVEIAHRGNAEFSGVRFIREHIDSMASREFITVDSYSEMLDGYLAFVKQNELGIRRLRAQVLPQDKANEVAILKAGGSGLVGMVGDGVNDAPALAAADVSFALASGSDVAIEAADITLMHSDLLGVADAIDLSRATLRKIRQNLFFAFFYNVLGIPLAAVGLLNPVVAGAAMAMSSVSVVTNSLLLRRWKPSRPGIK